jgi:hypothetical protein
MYSSAASDHLTRCHGRKSKLTAAKMTDIDWVRDPFGIAPKMSAYGADLKSEIIN